MLSTKFRFNQLSSFWEEDFQKSTDQKQELRVAAMFVNELGLNEQSIENLPYKFSTKFQFVWDSGFRGEDFLEINQSKTRWPEVAMFVNGSELNEQSLQRTFHRCFISYFDSFCPAVSEEKIFQKSTNQKQQWPVAAIFVKRSERNEQSLQRTFHRCFMPNFGSFGQTVSEEKIFKNRPITNKNCLWRSCLLMDRDKMSNFYRGPSIHTSYQASVHLAEGFQRRRLKCEKLTDDGRQTADDGCQVMAKAHFAFGKVS